MKTNSFLNLKTSLTFFLLLVFTESVYAKGSFVLNSSMTKSNFLRSGMPDCLPQTNSWERRYFGADEYDEVTEVIADSCGNVYVTGYSKGNGTGYDFATIKYNSSGDSLWVRRFDGGGDDYATAMAIDGSGNVLVAGYGFEQGEGFNYIVVKYDSDGGQLWVRTFDGVISGDDMASAIGTDDSGNVYVTGKSRRYTFMNDYLTLKYNSAGDLIWARKYQDWLYSNNEARSLALDAQGNVYVTGESQTENIKYDFLTIKYNPDGDSVWVRRYNGPDNLDEGAGAVKTDNAGNVLVSGYSYGSGTSIDYLTVKYDMNGNELWTKRFNGADNGADTPYSMDVDNSGNVYVTGASFSAFTAMDYLTIKYDPNGNEQWIQRYNGNSNVHDDIATGVAADNSGNVYVTGYATESGQGSEFSTVKYNSSGMITGVKHYNGTPNEDDLARTVAVDQLGNVYAAGSSRGSTLNFNYAVVKYSPDEFGFTDVKLKLTVYLQGFYDEVSNLTVRDTVRAYLRNGYPPYAIADSGKGFINVQGKATINFNSAEGGKYYYVNVKHRNSVEVLSSLNILGSEFSSYDFTTDVNSAFGNNLRQVGQSFCMIGGDVDQNGTIDAEDLGEIDNGAYHVLTGYVSSDLTGDGIVDVSDLAVANDNAFMFITRITPP